MHGNFLRGGGGGALEVQNMSRRVVPMRSGRWRRCARLAGDIMGVLEIVCDEIFLRGGDAGGLGMRNTSRRVVPTQNGRGGVAHTSQAIKWGP